MDLGLNGKVALVGGSSRGLGFAIARSLSREGVQVIITARTSQALQEAAEALNQETGGRVTARTCDLSQADMVKALAQETLAAQGRVDILVNNAGGPPSGDFLDFADQAWEEAFHLNLMSAVILSRAFLPGMKERGWGRIINMTSVAVKQPLEGLILSNSIRAGVHGWAKSLANEAAPFGITVNNIMPGYTLTDRVRNLAEDTARRKGLSPRQVLAEMEAAIPLGRLGRPEDVGDLAAYLASERAGFITGASFSIDGGLSRGLL